MSKASGNALDALHAALAEHFASLLKDGEPDDNGEPGPVKASTLNVIRQFLKDNSVTIAAGVPDNRMAAITEGLPFSDPDEHGLRN